jgi:solute carrier family 10 (sodium/bile acid cotransporter), member 7
VNGGTPAPAGGARTTGWLARNWFILGLAAAALLAFIVPGLGVRGGPLRPEITTKAGVALIFFLQGLALAPAALRAGALRWRLHLATQLFIFAAFPLAVLAIDRAAGGALPDELRLGFLFLAILPTTVSGCVVFTATAGGNVAGALFNSAVSNIAGVLITPLWAALLLGALGETPALGPMVLEIALLLLAPLAVGQAVRPMLARRREPDRKLLGTLSNVIILFIIFTAFANSVRSNAFAEVGLLANVLVAVSAGALFAAATGAAVLTARRLRFDDADRTAFLFCAPQKTLAAGAPMAQILFAGNPALGLILLPLIVYHAVQLVVGAMMADRLGHAHRTASPR